MRLQPFWDVSGSIFAAALMLALVSCQTTDKGPVGVVQAYCEAAYRGDCETWWSLLTANSRSAIEADVEYDKTGQKRELSAQKKMVCDFFDRASLDSKSAKLIRQGHDTAQVSVLEEVPTGFLIPHELPTSHFCREWQFPLIKETAGWRIDYARLDRPSVDSRTPCRKAGEAELLRAKAEPLPYYPQLLLAVIVCLGVLLFVIGLRLRSG